MKALAAVPIEHWTLPNGAKVYLAQSHGIPIVDVQIDFDAGARRDPVKVARAVMSFLGEMRLLEKQATRPAQSCRHPVQCAT